MGFTFFAKITLHIIAINSICLRKKEEIKMSLKYKAECMFDKINKTINLAVKQGYNSLDSIVNMDNDTIEGLRSVNETIKECQEYFVKQAEELDGMGDQLDRLQRQMEKMNSNLNLLLAKVDKEEQA